MVKYCLHFCLILLILLPNMACNNENISLEGAINREGVSTVWIIKEGKDSRVEEKIALLNGSFRYNTERDSFELITLKVPGLPFAVPFAMEGGKRVSFSISPDSIPDIAIKGDGAANELCALRLSLLPLIDEANGIRSFIDSIYKKDTLDYYQALITKDTTQAVDNRMVDLYTPYIENHPNTIYADIAIADLISATDKMLPLNSYIKRQAKQPNASFMAREIYRNYLDANFSRKGESLPEFVFKETTGGLRNFMATRRGIATLVTFWDPTEKYSRYVVSQISDMYKKIDEKKLYVYAIAITDDWKGLKKGLDTMKLKQQVGYLSIYKEAVIRRDIKPSPLPYTIFIDTKDLIRFIQPTAEMLEESIKPYIKEEKEKPKRARITPRK